MADKDCPDYEALLCKPLGACTALSCCKPIRQQYSEAAAASAAIAQYCAIE